MMAKYKWVKTTKTKDIEVWGKGQKPKNKLHLRKDFIIIRERGEIFKQVFPGFKYEVHAATRINPDTVNGKFRQYKTKSAALRFVKSYMEKR